MTETRPYGPTGDVTRHLPRAELDARHAMLAQAPRDTGTLRLIVRRRGDGVRETPDRVRLSPEEGVPGDDWIRLTPDDPTAQLTVMRHDVAELIANGQPLTVFGDNLFVDLDISAPNLPVGTRIKVGDATVEMSPKPHNGCQKFAGRFGADALRFVGDPATRHENRRGIYWTVIEAGDVTPGDLVTVVSRA